MGTEHPGGTWLRYDEVALREAPTWEPPSRLRLTLPQVPRAPRLPRDLLVARFGTAPLRQEHAVELVRSLGRATAPKP